MKAIALVLSCEHAVNTIPKVYQQYFNAHQRLLETHRGYDLGSEFIAKAFCQSFQCELIQATVSRLLIDCNRSLHHRQCFSEISKCFPIEIKNQLISDYYLPYRQKVEQVISEKIQEDKLVLHLSLHSFTPSLNEIPRKTEIGLLYDPKRSHELELAKQWRQQLKHLNPSFRIRLNYPYRGTSDGFTTSLRKKFKDEDYAGIEVESNQALVQEPKTLAKLSEFLVYSLQQLLSRLGQK